MTNTDNNGKLIYYILVEYYYVAYFTYTYLSYYQHIWKEIGVRVYQIVLESTPYQGFCVVHLSGEDMR